ncbi:Protein of unknown function DUF2157, membrane [Gemmatirosa kalamazoonensis]|uniref:DUF2157 domain-containing protein n=1 Tax=Gemmatirosa kalamazoonensis TaxID=861299 RepID=W0RGW7_9BACT|nr:hypothetical protein [Gemmatirosa kalamazoonensis]AHG89575.1 Protein of unknown function DUF2157, membrane [Gemmatirosa kalamazoonensis]
MGAQPGDAVTPSLRDTRALLARGVAAGVITPAQRDALLALPEPTRDDARSTLDGVTIAYWLGAALVVFALGWFLADRWEPLGPAGVLGVALAYGALLGAVATRLARVGFPLAAGVACALVPLTTSLVAWSLLRLTGEWPGDRASALLRYEPYMITRRLVVELSGALAALLMLRGLAAARPVRRTPIGVPLAAAAAAVLAECTTLVAIAAAGDERLLYMRGWAYGAAGTVLFGIAYATDVRQRPPDDAAREDFAAWLYLAACIVLEAGLLDAFSVGPAARHGLVVVALAQLGAAARLRRRVLLVAGMANAIWYLGYLAFDVFEGVVGFPLLLAAFGVAVLVVTVLVQRRFPSLVRRDGDWRPPSLPGGWLAAWAPAVVLAALLAVAVPRARQRAERARFARPASPQPKPPPRRPTY